MLARVVSLVIIDFNNLIKSNVKTFLDKLVGPDSNVLGKVIYNEFIKEYNSLGGNFGAINVNDLMKAIAANQI